MSNDHPGRDLHYSVFAVLLLLCPVFATDFIVSGGVVPISFVLFYFLYLYPSLFILAYWIIVPYAIVFFLFSRLAARKLMAISVAGRICVVTIVIAVFALLALFPVYRPISHGGSAWKNVISLFQDEYSLSTLLRR